MKIPIKKSFKVNLHNFSLGFDGGVDEKLSSITRPEKSFNFSTETGALLDGFGVSQLEVNQVKLALPEGVFAVKSYYRPYFDQELQEDRDSLCIYASDNNFYEFSLIDGSRTLVEDLVFDTAPIGVSYKLNGKDVLLLSSKESIAVYDGESVETYSAPEITSMCVHNERLFITTSGERTSLWFSTSFDPTNWYVSLDEAGFIDFQDGLGKLLRVVSFNGYVYIFREYGITRLYAPTEQMEFFASNIACDRVRIYGESIAVTGKNIIYLTDNGFYCFTGSSFSRVAQPINSYLFEVDKNQNFATYFNGKYYCQTTFKLDDVKENAVLCYDIAEGNCYLFKGCKFSYFEAVNESLVNNVIFLVEGQNKIGVLDKGSSVFGLKLNKIWQSKKSDFDYEKRKVLTKVSFYLKGSATFTFCSDEGEKTINVSGKNTLQKVMIGLSGTEFYVKIFSKEKNVKISKITLNFSCF